MADFTGVMATHITDTGATDTEAMVTATGATVIGVATATAAAMAIAAAMEATVIVAASEAAHGLMGAEAFAAQAAVFTVAVDVDSVRRSDVPSLYLPLNFFPET
jgi:hypothetical protein